MAGVAPPSKDGGKVGHEAVHGGTKSETGADLQGMGEEDSLGVLIRERGDVESPLLNLSNIAVPGMAGPGGGWWPTA